MPSARSRTTSTTAIPDRSDGPSHPNALRLNLTRRREQRNRPPPVPVDLPSEAKACDIAVRDHDLGGYDGLAEDPEEDSEE